MGFHFLSTIPLFVQGAGLVLNEQTAVSVSQLIKAGMVQNRVTNNGHRVGINPHVINKKPFWVTQP
jgi:hypothetical protein